jgi:hypothetical protein
MTDTDPRTECVTVQAAELFVKTREPARCTSDLEASLLEQRDARAVVSAILEPFETIEQDRDGLTCSEIADDSTHAVLGPFRK